MRPATDTRDAPPSPAELLRALFAWLRARPANEVTR